jgi:anthranilate phosphoribosyltransferase
VIFKIYKRKDEIILIKEAIKKVVAGNDLSYEEAVQVMNEMFTGTATQAQMAAILTALRIKGETIDEITAFASVMREKALHVEHKSDVLDIVGTGGDGTGTFNISTTSAFVIAAAGISVAKHGNRSMSSKSGASDCLENLGVNLMVSPEKNSEVLEKTGICFMHAQNYHSSMKYVGPVRKEIGIRNVFNLLGPLTNPASANLQVTGVYSEALVEPVARVFSNLGVKRGFVFYGADGMDEVTVTGETKVCEIDNGNFKTFTITPEEFGLKRYDISELVGGDGAENAEITRKILSGEIKGAKRDIVLLNSALGLVAGGKSETIADGIKMAGEIIDSGKALAKVEEFAKATNE